MQTEMFQRKPLTVEAVRVTTENIYDVAKWCGGDVTTGPDKKKFIKIDVLHPIKPDQTRAEIGNWVLKSKQGFKIFNDVAFKKGWERVGNVGRALVDAASSIHKPDPNAQIILTNNKGVEDGIVKNIAPGSPAMKLHETMTKAERDIVDGVKEA